MLQHNNIDWTKYRVLRLPQGERPVNRKYGLWIFASVNYGLTRQRYKPLPTKVEYYGISHLLKGNGIYFTSDGTQRNIEEGDGVMVCPGILHDFPGIMKTYLQDSIWFTGSVADRFRECGIIRSGVLRIGKARRLLPVIKLSRDPSVDSQIQANIAFESLLVQLYMENYGAKAQPAYPSIGPLIEELKRSPERWWTVGEMAEYCNLSPSRFNIVFRKATGTSPKHYFDQLKMNYASELLVTTDHTICHIAESLGYTSPFHFSRRFKSIIGKSPLQYRQDTHSR